ncbi:MAG: MarR family winged helix-turn-helix transcriptional regulator [Pseudomonadales bacterium]
MKHTASDMPSAGDITKRISFALHTASRLVKQASVEQLKTLELTQAQWRALSGVCTQPSATLQQLTAFAQISQPLLSQAIKALEGRGLVERRRDESDKRSSLIVATAAGMDCYREAYAAMMKVETQINEVLGPSDSKVFKALLDRLVEELD